MKKLSVTLIAALLFSFLFISCEKDDDTTTGKFDNGVIVLNEGAYGNSNASVSWVSYKSDSVVNNVFYSVNGRSIGDVLQSAIIYKGKIYMILNNSHKVEIASSSDFVQAGTIEGLNTPRYATVANNSLYITQWNSWGQKGAVMVYDLSSLSKIDSIPVGYGPEQILYSDGKLWVANGGGLSKDSTISVINPLSNEVEKTIEVAYSPTRFTVDANNNIWTICSGLTIYGANFSVIGHKPSKLAMINPDNEEVEKTVDLFAEKHPTMIDINPDGNTLYFGGGWSFDGIYTLNISSTSYQGPIINGSVYGFNVNPKNGDIYCLEAPTFTAAGTLKVYNSNGGEAVKTVEVGIGPNGVLFN